MLTKDKVLRWFKRQLDRRATHAAFRAALREPAPLRAEFFDAEWYVRNNPDVAASGVDPWFHYLDHGAREGRSPGPAPAPAGAGHASTRLAIPTKCAPNRRAFLLQHVDKASKVLEIGGAFNPILRKDEGFRVFTLDNGDQDELRARWAGVAELDLSKIQPVDFVWKGGEILDAIPSEHLKSFDVIFLASVIEHFPNPIGALRSLQKLLKPGGRLTLSAPDRSHCFDLLRPVTTTGAWLEAFARGDTLHTPRNLFESKTMSVARRGRIIWVEDRVRADDATFVGADLSTAYAKYFAATGNAGGEYEDAHAWVFTPSSFTLLLNECHQLGLIQLVPERVSQRMEAEFLVHLRLAQRRPINHLERMQLLAASAREQAEGHRGVAPARDWLDAISKRSKRGER